MIKKLIMNNRGHTYRYYYDITLYNHNHLGIVPNSISNSSNQSSPSINAGINPDNSFYSNNDTGNQVVTDQERDHLIQEYTRNVRLYNTHIQRATERQDLEENWNSQLHNTQQLHNTHQLYNINNDFNFANDTADPIRPPPGFPNRSIYNIPNVDQENFYSHPNQNSINVNNIFRDVIVCLNEEQFELIDVCYTRDIQDKLCSICQESVKTKIICKELNCSHTFHIKCLRTWLCERSVHCPECRYDTRNTLPDTTLSDTSEEDNYIEFD